MVFLVDKYKGYFLSNAYSKQDLAKPVIDSLVLYIARPQPPPFGKSKTSHFCYWPPSLGVNTTSNFPGLSITKSVALY